MENKSNIFYLIKEYSPLVRKTLKWIFIPIILGGLGAFMFYKSEKAKPSFYFSAIIYILDDELNSGGGASMSAGSPMLSAMMGGSGGSNKALMVDLSKSNKLIESTLLSKVFIDNSYVILANYYIDKCGLRDQWKQAKDAKMLKIKYPENYLIGSNKDMDYLIRSISKTIQSSYVSKEQESGLIIMEYKSTNELFSKAFIDNHFATISDFYTERKSVKSNEVTKLTRQKKDNFLAAVQSKEAGLALSQDKDFGVVMNRAKLDNIANARELAISQEQYKESIVAYNAALLEQQRIKPIISVVDDPRLPLKKVGTNPSAKATQMGIVFFIVSLALLVAVLFGLEFISKQKKEYLSFKA